MFDARVTQAIGVIDEAATSLAVTGGEFTPLPWIIGAVALIVLGGGALLLVRRRAK